MSIGGPACRETTGVCPDAPPNLPQRQGAMMQGPDWTHWHGFFELQQDIYAMEDIYEKWIATGEIED